MRVGKPHGLDGSFYVEAPAHPLEPGTELRVGDLSAAVERRAGTAARPIVRIAGVTDRDAAEALRGAPIAVAGAEADEPLGEGEWRVEDLLGCRIEGLGEVRRVLETPSCDVLEVGERGELVPLVSDAVRRVDVEHKLIEIDRGFLGLET